MGMIDQEFEGPLFKVLSKNDSGAGVGHQAGFVIPKELRYFFPALPMPTAANPAPNVSLRAILVLDDGAPVLVETGYQFQSWGGTRQETRITGNLNAVRAPSTGGDILLIERGRTDPRIPTDRTSQGPPPVRGRHDAQGSGALGDACGRNARRYGVSD